MMKAVNNISIKNKLNFVFGFLILSCFVSFGFITYESFVLKHAFEDMQHISYTQNAVQSYDQAVVRARQAISSFINSGTIDYVEQFNNSDKAIEPAFKEAEGLMLKYSPDLVDSFRKTFALYKQWKLDIANDQIILMQDPYTVDQARFIESSQKNRTIWSDNSALLETIKAALNTQNYEMIRTEGRVVDLVLMACLIFGITTIVICVFVSVVLNRIIAVPLGRLARVTEALRDRNWGVKIDNAERLDEVGIMAKALMVFRDNGQENEKLQEQQKAEDEKRLQRARRIEELVNQFSQESNDTLKALESATQDMQTTSRTMSSIAEQTNSQSVQVASAAQEAGANVDNVAAATEELTSSINEISLRLNQTSEKAGRAMETSKDAVRRMKTLEQAAQEIGQVVQIITDIAEQTNLLALNATIESARAGEAGKGFAVVANEVKTLAGETAKATSQISSQIDHIQAETRQAVSMIDGISRAISELTEASSSIAAAMEEQTSATQEISRNVSEAASGTSSVVRGISDVSKGAGETGHSAEKVYEVSEGLAKRSEMMKQSVETFIRNIKAA